MPPTSARFLRHPAGRSLALVVVSATAFLPALVPEPLGVYLAMALMTVLIFGVTKAQGDGVAGVGLARPRSWGRTLALGVLYFGAAFLLLRVGLEPLLERWTGVERDLSRFAYLEGNGAALLQTLVMLWLTAGFWEELYFRGFLVPQIAALGGGRRLGWALGIVLSSAAFAAAHGYQSVSGVVLTGVGGALLGGVFVAHGRNLWIPIVVHTLHDASGALFIYLGIYEHVTHLLF
jgi:CAAX protease family protein